MSAASPSRAPTPRSPAIPAVARGLNIKAGEIVYEPVATAYAEGAPVAAW